MITREQVADLHPGDVVRISLDDGHGFAVEGPLRWSEQRVQGGDALVLDHPHIAGTYWVRNSNGTPYDEKFRTLTVVSRAPRPLYVNHPRTEPVAGDVVRDADTDDHRVWMFVDPADNSTAWVSPSETDSWWQRRSDLPARLRLLVDGETGMAVVQ